MGTHYGYRPSGNSPYTPAPTVISDPQFNYVSMLLHGDGTNGSQNNAFIDSSTNNFTITRNGNTTQGSLSPYGNLWSNYFDGSGDYLTVPNNAALNLSSGDWTIELWVWWNGGNSEAVFIDKDGVGGSTYPSYDMGVNGSGYARVIVGNGSANAYFQIINSSTLLPKQSWVHLAAVKSGSTITLYQNGVNVVSATQTGTIVDGGKPLYIGYQPNQPAYLYLDGYLSNVRIVKGTALYTSNFTPSTTPFTAVSGTSLLTCQSNRFIDNSANNFTIARNGDVRVTKESPFLPTAAYSTSTIGGSGYFDGTGDALSVPVTTNLQLGTGNFTFEFWLYVNSTASVAQVINTINSSGNDRSLAFFRNGTSLLYYLSSNGSTSWDIANGVNIGTIAANTWYHVALVRNGSTFTPYLNGTAGTTTTSSSALFSPANLYVGNEGSFGTIGLNGYISNMRIVKGTAVYTAAFTPPTAPVTAITNTSLLLNFTNAGIFDNAAENVLETVGTAQISTSVKKYGTGSIAFDGTASTYLLTQSSSQIEFGSGNFTIELWINFTTAPSNTAEYLLWHPVNHASGSKRLSIMFYANSVTIGYFGTNVAGTTLTWTTGQWYHLAFVRNGNTWTIYRDGTSVASGTDTSTLDAASGYYTGQRINGYIDDLRITKGVARYTANFTPPTAAFTDQ